MKYGDVCTGIGAASAAWKPLGWDAAFNSEIEGFPRSVLSHHYPETPLHGDFTTIGKNQYDAIDLLVGGTPCQSFSIAGLRQGHNDERGHLSLEYLKLAARLCPRWFVWENVPNALSTNDGRDFSAFIGGLSSLGYGFCWRVLNAKNYGVPQKRRRLFVIGYLGDWRPPAAVLFDKESMRWNPGTRKTPRENYASGSGICTEVNAGHVVNRMRGFGDYVVDDHASTLRARDYKDYTDLVFSFQEVGSNSQGGKDILMSPDSFTLKTKPSQRVVQLGMARKYTPLESERLQGFSDNYTLVDYKGKPARDALRYKAIGNSMAVPVMQKLGERIDLVDSILEELADA